MGYKAQEQIIPTARNHAQRWTEVMEKSDHTVTLIDLCGHEKYLKTTLFGLTGAVMYSYTLYIYIYILIPYAYLYHSYTLGYLVIRM